jgi:beta-mannosidase
VIRTPIDGFVLSGTANHQPPASDAVWWPALVPGGVHESLMAADQIAHPFLDENEITGRWVEERTWWYRTTFAGPDPVEIDERLRLVFHGLDTVATVWLNQVELGSQANQHRPAIFDITALIREENELLVRFTPPLIGLEAPAVTAEAIAEFAERRAELSGDTLPVDAEKAPLPELSRTLRRKATFSWGWDFGPRLPSIGLHAPVELCRDRIAIIDGRYIRTTALDVDARTATLSVTIDVEAFAGQVDLVRFSITSPTGDDVVVERPAADRVEFDVPLEGVHVWWSHDLGSQPLYRATIDLIAGDDVIDTVSERVGIRQIALDRSPDDEGGNLFRFVLNGVPIFARGANWIPLSLLIGSVTPETCRDFVATARRGEMNMLRIWGGGHYEQEAFWEACDELGVLVWLDFMFACNDYPSDDPALAAEVALEAAFQVCRLRNHAALAIWAGNNEVQAIHQFSAGGSLEPGNWGWSFFHQLLPEAVATHSPGALYWPGSPWGESDERTVNGVLDGDRHAWEVWHGLDIGAGGPTDFANRGEAVHFSRYGYDHGKFISEFGIHASPERATLERWITAGSLELGGSELVHRNKDNPKDKGFAMMEFETGRPTTLDQYVDYSMACQAEGMKFGVEHYRRRQPHCSGTLVWQFNDTWPGISWSVLDFDGIGKASYYFLQRAYRPIIASFGDSPEGASLWVTNSGAATVDLTLSVQVASFDGTVAHEEQLQVQSAGGSSVPVWITPVRPSAGQFVWVSDAAGVIAPNRRFFARLKDLPLDQAAVQATVRPTGSSTASVELVSEGYSYSTHVLAPAPNVTFSSNYLDLRTGDRVTIDVAGLPEGFNPASLEVRTYDRPTPHPLCLA